MNVPCLQADAVFWVKTNCLHISIIVVFHMVYTYGFGAIAKHLSIPCGIIATHNNPNWCLCLLSLLFYAHCDDSFEQQMRTNIFIVRLPKSGTFDDATTHSHNNKPHYVFLRTIHAHSIAAGRASVGIRKKMSCSLIPSALRCDV